MSVIEATEGADVLVHWDAPPSYIAARGAGLAYLASPLTGRLEGGARDPWDVSEQIVLECARDLDELACAGVSAISPVLMALEMISARPELRLMSLHGPRGLLDHGFWMRWSGVMLARCDLVVVPDRPGWRESLGIAAEVRAALARNVPVFFMGVRDEFPALR